jgi:hypothetical protein
MTDPAAPELEPTAATEGGAPGKSDVAGTVYLAIFTAYVVLLGIGVVAEAFHIQWILKWPIY